jgi:ABC-type phosphate/phosphonate transport system ATPase subunit
LVQRYSTSVIGLREGRIVYQGNKKQIMRMTDTEFKTIYGEEAERMGGISGDLSDEEETVSDGEEVAE